MARSCTRFVVGSAHYRRFTMGGTTHCASRSENFVRARPATHCHTPSHPVAPWAVMRQGAGSSRTLHTVLPSSCTYAQSPARHCRCSFLNRVAQSAYVAPTTKCKRRAAVVPKCVVNDGFHSNNNGYRLKSITTNQARTPQTHQLSDATGTTNRLNETTARTQTSKRSEDLVTTIFSVDRRCRKCPGSLTEAGSSSRAVRQRASTSRRRGASQHRPPEIRRRLPLRRPAAAPLVRDGLHGC